MSTLSTEGVWGIVLAGAYPRERLAFDRLLPRPLLPVADAPIITYPLRWLSGSVCGVSACVNSAARAVRSLLEATPGMPHAVEFYEDWMPRGAAGCVRDAGLRTNARTFVVVDGTTIPHLDLHSLVTNHRRLGAALTLAVHAEPGGPPGGRRLSPDGVYVIERGALDYVADHGFQDIKEGLIPRLHAAGQRIAVYECQRACPRIYDFESYLAVNRWAISALAREGRVPEGYELREEAFVHATSRVSPRARLVGPLVLGPGVTVDDHATLVGPTAIGSGSLVASGAVVSRSVLWSNCRLGADSLLDRCLLADAAVVPPRTSLYDVLRSGPLRQPVPGQGVGWLAIPHPRPSPAGAAWATERS